MDTSKRYQVILADPPWAYENKRTGGSMISGASSKYPTMTLEEIKALPVPDITEKNAVLFLWVTTPLLPEAFEVVKAWGFTYKTALYWRKIMSLGMGYWFRGQVEVCLFATRGGIAAFRCQRPNFLQSKVRQHSRKPDQLYGLIEEIALKHNLGPKIELFARQRREGWDAYGNQIAPGVQMVLA